MTTTSPLGVEDLQQLMRSVNETTERLQRTHTMLQQQVASLQSELAEANAQLRRSRSLAALGEMAAGIAHEVRNPLASIGLYAQMLTEDLADRPDGARLAEKITGAVDRIDTIVRDVLRFATDTTLHPQLVLVTTLIDQALESCRSSIVAADIDVVREGDRVRLEVDTTLMAQALANVICNAAEAMESSRSDTRVINISARRERRRLPAGGHAEHVVIRVRDCGPGISPDVLERMFNPFFTTRRTGTGLGLAIVHRIVEAHGGHVVVSNNHEGGATVALCLPPSKARSTQ